MQSTINQAGINIIKESEGLELKPYLCPSKIPTIGYGTTVYPNGQRVSMSDPSISKQQAEQYLRHDLRQFEQEVSNLVKVPLNTNEFSALVSFVYNIGASQFSKSTLLRLLNSDTVSKERVADEFLRWNKSNGRVLPGLVDRREKERDLFLEDTFDKQELPEPSRIRFTANSILKTAPVSSSTLKPEEKKDVFEGSEFVVSIYEDNKENNHIFFQDKKTGESWFAYKGHLEVVSRTAEIVKKEKEVDRDEDDPYILLPGFSSTRFYLNDPILPKGNFTWSEATKGGSRIPESKQIVSNIVRIARELEEVRKLFGNRPVIVVSWYRDPVSNRRVGGATRSQHLQGNAADIHVSGLDIWHVQKELIDYWYLGRKGGLGKGADRGFVHLDLGPVRIWDY